MEKISRANSNGSERKEFSICKKLAVAGAAALLAVTMTGCDNNTSANKSDEPSMSQLEKANKEADEAYGKKVEEEAKEARKDAKVFDYSNVKSDVHGAVSYVPITKESAKFREQDLSNVNFCPKAKKESGLLCSNIAEGYENDPEFTKKFIRENLEKLGYHLQGDYEKAILKIKGIPDVAAEAISGDFTLKGQPATIHVFIPTNSNDFSVIYDTQFGVRNSTYIRHVEELNLEWDSIKNK